MPPESWSPRTIETELRTLLGRVRAGFAQLDAGEIDEFDMDDVIHHFERSAAELWKFCGRAEASGSGLRTP